MAKDKLLYHLKDGMLFDVYKVKYFLIDCFYFPSKVSVYHHGWYVQPNSYGCAGD